MTGVQRYAIELVKSIDGLLERDAAETRGMSFALLAPSAPLRDLRLKHIPVRSVGRMKGHWWEQLELPVYAKDGLLLNLCNTSPLLKRNQVTTIHDASVYAVPQTYSFPFRAWYKLQFALSKRSSKRIITDSSFSRDELIRYCRIPPSRIKAIPLGKEHVREHRSDPDYLSRVKGDKPYVLAVSSMNPNKNFRSIVRAAEIAGGTEYDVVIAGGTHPKVFGSSAEPDYGGYKYVGYVSDSQLRTLYEHADCFIYPSFYEGFGLPPLEAMASGCPVIVSDRASLPEVCGDAALYCDPHDPSDIAKQLVRIMGDSELRETLRTKGLERSRQFSWEKCSTELLAVIREVLECGSPSSMTG